MKRILTTLKQKWPEYLLEVLVITAGILGAFILNNWNDQRQESNKEAYLLEMLYKELKQDSTQLASYQSLIESHANRAEYLLKNLDNSSPNMDSIISSVFFSGRFLWFKSNSPTYDEILSSGQLGLLRSDSLKGLLSEYHGLQESYVTFLLLESQNNKAAYNEHRNKYFDLSIMSEYWKARGKAIPIDSLRHYDMDWEGFRLDPNSRVQLRNSRGVNNELLILYERSYWGTLNPLLAYLRSKISFDS